jgi:hypothetical protein
MKSQIDSDQATLEVIVKLIYEKALFAPRFAPLYADLCAILAKELQSSVQRDQSTDKPMKDFKTCILDHCKVCLFFYLLFLILYRDKISFLLSFCFFFIYILNSYSLISNHVFNCLKKKKAHI